MNGRKWRKKPSEELIKLMEESVDLKLYLIHERGPLSLTFQDEQNKKFEINIGNEISCSCGGGKIEHCAHTLFALNKIYKIPFNNPLILQLQFTNQELDTLMEKKKKKSENKKAKESRKLHPRKKREKELTNQMSLLDDPICPICQEDMYSNEGIYFCKPSCGHNFHIGCLKVFIKHKKDTDMVVSCPMCRAKWEEEDYIKPLTEIRPNKCIKNHKGINCSNCQRTNIKFERFHCLNCDNYDLCIECFSAEIHRDKNHCFIFKKHNEDKWTGCEYKRFEDWEEEDDNEENKINNKNNNLNYFPINISLTHFLMNCLPDYKNDGSFQIKMDQVGNSNQIENRSINNNINNQNQINNNENNNDDLNDINNLRLENNMQRPVHLAPKCAICKVPSKLDYGRYNAKTLEFLMLKYLSNCQHIIHVKCCEKAFKMISYEKKNKFLIVSQYFNRCRHDNKIIYPGLMSINLIFEKDKKPSTGNNNNRGNNKSSNKLRTNTPLDDLSLPGIFNIKNSYNNAVNRKMQGYSSNTKKMMIEKLLREAQIEKEQNMGFGLNIQKLNFGGQNDIQKYEMEVLNKGSYNEKIKRKGMVGKIPYTQIHKLKKAEHITINSNMNRKLSKEDRKNIKEIKSENKMNVFANAGQSLIVQKYNARPVRYEGPGKISLSPLLIDLPLNNNNNI